MEILDQDYWQNLYKTKEIGWDIGEISNPLKVYFDQIEDKTLKILIPGGGNAYEAEYLHINGFGNVFLLDWAEAPLANFKKRVASFPENHLVNANFFDYSDQFDLIIEQTFFCAINPSLRPQYVKQMHNLLKPDAKLVGLYFGIEFEKEGPPFGGNQASYEKLFKEYFQTVVLEPCHNSIKPRQGSELFAIFRKR